MENYLKKRLATDQSSMLLNSAACPPASFYCHSHDLAERFCDNIFFSEQPSSTNSSQASESDISSGAAHY